MTFDKSAIQAESDSETDSVVAKMWMQFGSRTKFDKNYNHSLDMPVVILHSENPLGRRNSMSVDGKTADDDWPANHTLHPDELELHCCTYL